MNYLSVLLHGLSLEIFQLLCERRWSHVLQVNQVTQALVVEHIEYLHLDKLFRPRLNPVWIGLFYVV